MNPRAVLQHPTSWLRPSSALLFGGLLALGACTTPVIQSDAPSPDAAEASTAPDAPSAPDAPLSPDAADAPSSPDAADATTPSEGGTCANFEGAWEWTGTCSDPNLQLAGTSCIAQTGCTTIEHSSSGASRGSVVGDTLTTPFFVDSTTPSGSCAITLSGGMARAHCTVTGSSVTCDATLTRQTFPGATRYCCDPGASSCGAGQRCQVFSGSSLNARFTACIPAGTIAENQTCTRAGGRIGADDCAAGLSCANYGQPSLNQRACRRLCNATGDCRSGEACLDFGDSPEVGFCLPTCTPFGSDCAAGFTCRTQRFWSGTAHDQQRIVIDTQCSLVGSVAPGGACMDPTDCIANHDCFLDPTVAGSMPLCRQNCDATHTCPTGQHCLLQRTPDVNARGIGHCFPD